MSIASASTVVKFHDLSSGNLLHSYQPNNTQNSPIRSISWSKDGNWLALVPQSGLAEIISVKDQLKLIHKIQGVEEPTCASFQNNTKKNIVIGTKSGQVLVYDVKDRKVKKTYPRTNSTVTRVSFTAKDGHVVASCENGQAYIYSNVQNNLSGTFRIPRSQTISALRTNPTKRNYIVGGSDEGVVSVWDLHANKAKFFVGAHKAPVTDAAFSPISPDLVVSTGLDRQFCFYDIGSGKCVGNIFVENSMAAVDFSPDGKLVVMASVKGKVHVYDSRNIQQAVHCFSGHNGPVEHLLFRKCEDYESSFSMSEMAGSEPNANTESFDIHFLSGNNATADKSKNAEDSFLAAVGLLDHSKSSNSVRQDSFPRFDNSPRYMYKITPTMTKCFSGLIQDELALATSTPELLNQESGLPAGSTVNPPQVPIEDLVKSLVEDRIGAWKDELKADVEELTKSNVKEELRQMLELSKEIKNSCSVNLMEANRMYVHTLVTVAKGFMKVNENIDVLHNNLVSDLPQTIDSLQEENAALKGKIALLEEEIALLKSQ